MSNNQKGIALIICGILSFLILPNLANSIMSFDTFYTNQGLIRIISIILAVALIWPGVRILIKTIPKAEDDQIFETSNKTNDSSSSSFIEINKVVNVTLTGGIIGMLGGSPHGSLNKIIKRENQNGWRVIQIIPSDQGNLFISILRFIVLIVTLFFYTTASGYYIIMEKSK